MPREKEYYRTNYEMLLDAFPEKKLLNSVDVAKWAGIDRRTAKRLYFKDKQYISLAELASKIS